ncbi:uncharacterized protein F5Z01DRAFT_738601 [Emericellopsis atlantica]|uniref:Gylcosyl hydrolase 115 C-terminal domain-containing protein n=1 Tax=Emericellopsis atlantica TaxID=2614577 RepID=A0A9P7ZHI8_9HYPO|nr:uncharacterized protein F5Z01DRAFT_738601 [Emericellopsis atlantica]KAG9252041.1 hypothetical protein F5Z01DRAFT_738601 [Emericellopsis atlantica]
MSRKLKVLIGAIACFPLCAWALLDDAIVSFEASDSCVDITYSNILCSPEEPVGIHIAAESLATDFQQITGVGRSVIKVDGADAAPASDTAIIVGSLDSALIQHLSSNGHLDVSQLEGKWESFVTSVVENPLPSVQRALVIAGSDKRGTIFGIYTLAEQSGQSPYHFWADVPPKKHDHIFALAKTVFQGEPSVQYRGLFINDEEPALNGWWARYNGQVRHPLDSGFYAHVFDLLLRLRANYLWPAMWASSTPPPGNIFFTDDPKNQQLADDYGIVVGTSHHEPMQRATNEWNVSETGGWDWSKNRGNMTTFMDEGVARAGNNESYFTIGIRGLGDEAMEADDASRVLSEVFEVQREIIEKYHGSKDAVPQVWALYKEVMPYYEAGLNPPDDVTILFPDDNFGNVHRLPIGNESERAGGCGAKVYKELSQTYMRGATGLWVINVGDIKPMEVPLNMAMDMAWNMDRFTPDKLLSYLEAFATREFGPDHAKETAEVLLEYSHLVGIRKYEHVTSGTYSVVNYHEAERVLGRWKTLAARAKSVHDQLPEKLKPAYYQLVYYPAATGAVYHSVVIGVGMNYRHAQERRNSANQLAHEVLALFDESYDFVEAWDAMLCGKWQKMMSQAVYDAVPQDPKLWANPSRDLLANISFVQLRQNMQLSEGNLGLYAEESDSPVQQARWAESVDSSMPTVEYPALLPVMDPYGPPVRHLDVFHRGDYRVPIHWTLGEMPEPWVSIQPASGTVGDDHMVERLNITIDWAQVPESFNDTIEIEITATPAEIPYFDLIRVPVLKTQLPDDFVGFPETAGFISIESPHFQQSSSGANNGTVHFVTMPYLGSRSESGALAVRRYKAARQNNAAARDAWVEYSIYLFTDADDTSATLYCTTGLETDPQLKMEYSLTLDDAPVNMTRVLGDYISEDYIGDVPPVWVDQVMDQVWTLHVDLGPIEAGEHTLRWAVNSPEVYLEKIVLDTHGGVKPSYLGPPETSLVGA